MRFVKMEGLGNDYLYVDLFREQLPEPPETLAVRLSRPHFGVGADGLILIGPSDRADARMRVFNADGSEAKMCGNGIRCVGKYLYDSGRCTRETLRVDTLAGIRSLKLTIEDGVCTGAGVDMGIPVFGKTVFARAAGRDWALQEVSMGNPHGVCLMPEPIDIKLFCEAGPLLERHEAFPDRANIEFCHAMSRTHIRVDVWERGSGRTLACGTGACAAMATACREGKVERRCRVTLPGGDLDILWREDDHIIMTGPARTVFTGEWPGAIRREEHG
ncbi:MAG: diaminopimelate epimerase [Clostridiales bacterium]|jgi:diaminopimelate epimerase|nr:diaminopimelate epimerase [Bacillota bacterium]NLL55351.1 diaminopimelate epimerase [Clostridiales bacterium]